MRVAVICSDAELRDMLVARIVSMGHPVTHRATSGPTGIDAVLHSASEVNLVFTWFDLGGEMNGCAVADQIIDHNPACSVVIVNGMDIENLAGDHGAAWMDSMEVSNVKTDGITDAILSAQLMASNRMVTRTKKEG